MRNIGTNIGAYKVAKVLVGDVGWRCRSEVLVGGVGCLSLCQLEQLMKFS